MEYGGNNDCTIWKVFSKDSHYPVSQRISEQEKPNSNIACRRAKEKFTAKNYGRNMGK